MKRALTLLLFFIMLAVFFVPMHGVHAAERLAWPEQLRLMTGPPGGNWAMLGSAYAEVLTRELVRTVNSAGGGVANILCTDSRKGDMGLTVASFVRAAVRGEQDFAGRSAEHTVVMANLYAQAAYFIMRKKFADEHNIHSVDDMLQLKVPVRFATLKPGTTSEFIVRALLDKGFATDLDALKQERHWSVEYVSYEGGADLMADELLDCLAFSVGQTATIVKNIEAHTDVVLLSVGQEALDAVAAAYGTNTLEIKPGTYKSVTEPIKTVGDYTSIVVRKDLPESLVFALNKALWENKSVLSKAVSDMQELSPELAIPQGLPTHPGSIKFWNSVRQ